MSADLSFSLAFWLAVVSAQTGNTDATGEATMTKRSATGIILLTNIVPESKEKGRKKKWWILSFRVAKEKVATTFDFQSADERGPSRFFFWAGCGIDCQLRGRWLNHFFFCIGPTSLLGRHSGWGVGTEGLYFPSSIAGLFFFFLSTYPWTRVFL